MGQADVLPEVVGHQFEVHLHRVALQSSVPDTTVAVTAFQCPEDLLDQGSPWRDQVIPPLESRRQRGMMLVRPMHDSVLDPHGPKPLTPLPRFIGAIPIHRPLISTDQLVRHLALIHLGGRQYRHAHQAGSCIYPDMRLVAEVCP